MRQPSRSGACYLKMKRPVLNADTGAAFGLIAGIILGSLALNLSGAADPPAPCRMLRVSRRHAPLQ